MHEGGLAEIQLASIVVAIRSRCAFGWSSRDAIKVQWPFINVSVAARIGGIDLLANLEVGEGLTVQARASVYIALEIPA